MRRAICCRKGSSQASLFALLLSLAGVAGENNRQNEPFGVPEPRMLGRRPSMSEALSCPCAGWLLNPAFREQVATSDTVQRHAIFILRPTLLDMSLSRGRSARSQFIMLQCYAYGRACLEVALAVRRTSGQ